MSIYHYFSLSLISISIHMHLYVIYIYIHERIAAFHNFVLLFCVWILFLKLSHMLNGKEDIYMERVWVSLLNS